MSSYHKICMSDSAYLIAEAGVNHNGDLNMAFKLIDAAKKSGANAVKFQTFKTENLISRSAPLARYQKKSGERSQFEMAKRLELSFGDFVQLKCHAEKLGITFLSTPDDEESLEFLVSLDLELIKIGSGEITNLPFLYRVAQKNKPIILSTGMSTLAEVKEAIEVINNAGNRRLILLHCVSAYPTPVDQVNLKAMFTLQENFRLPVGFSDHTTGLAVPLAAASLGAVVIEKHFTLDCSLQGPDHSISLEPLEMKALADGIKEISLALGTGIKEPAPCEIDNKSVVQKKIVAKRDLKAGEKLAPEHLACKRAGKIGIEPKHFDRIIGLKTRRSVKQDTPLEWEMLLA